MATYKLDKDMAAPSVEDFDGYQSTPIKGLKYSGIKWQQTGQKLKITLNTGRNISFFAFSKNGFTESKKGGKYYIRLNGSDADNSKDSLLSAIEKITLFCVDVWRLLKNDIIKRLKGVNGVDDTSVNDLKTSVSSGLNDVSYSDDEKDNLNISYTVFAGKWTKLFAYDEKTLSLKATSLGKLTGKSGNSHFSCDVNVRTVEVDYDPISELFAIKTYVNPSSITWINMGQKCEVTDDWEQEQKEFKEQQKIKEISLFVANKNPQLTGKRKKPAEENIPTSKEKRNKPIVIDVPKS